MKDSLKLLSIIFGVPFVLSGICFLFGESLAETIFFFVVCFCLVGVGSLPAILNKYF